MAERPVHKIVTSEQLAIEHEELRLGVTKRLLERGDGTPVKPPYALITASYKIIAIAPEVAQHHSTRASPAKNDLPAGTETVIEEKTAQRMLLGMEALTLGLEIVLGSMRQGERSLFYVPNPLTHPDGVEHTKLAAHTDWWLDIKLVSVANGESLSNSPRHEIVKFLEQAAPASAAESLHPAYESTVQVSIKSLPRNQFTKKQFTVGSDDSSYMLDKAVMSMEVREAATIFHNKQEHFIMLLACEQPPAHFRREKSVDSTTSTYVNILQPEQRFSEADSRLQCGQRLQARGEVEMAFQKYDAALMYLTANPPLPGSTERVVNLYTLIAETRLAMNDWAMAHRYAEAAVAGMTPISPYALLLRARCHRFLKRFEEASKDLQLLKEVVKSGPICDQVLQEESDLAAAVGASTA